MYYDYAMAAPLMAGCGEDGSRNILILGMGSGTYAVQCSRYFQDLKIEGVEIDEKIVDLSRRYFDLPASVPVTVYDGRAYLQAIDEKYDVIMVDAYQDITIPFQMSSVEFFSMVREHLRDGGVMVVNMNMKGSGEGAINDYLADTIDLVFDDVYTVDVPGTTNRELFASDSGQLRERLEQSLTALSDSERDRELHVLMSRLQSHLEPYTGGGRILTDDQAPVELLGMKVIDELIAEEVAYYRTVYERDGLSGLLDQVL